MTILASDNFSGTDGAAPDAAKWVLGVYSNKVIGAILPKITGNQLDLLLANATTATGVISVNAFNLGTQGGVHVKAPQFPNEINAMCSLMLATPANSGSTAGSAGVVTAHHRIEVERPQLRVYDSGGYSFGTTYSASAHAYLRLQVEGTNVQAYASPTGLAGSWVAIGAARPSLVTTGSVKAALTFDAWGGGSFASSVLFDDYQVDDDAITTAAAGGGVSTSVSPSVPDGRIFRHSATTWSLAATGSIVETGAYSGFTPNQIRLVEHGTNTPLAGFDWTTIGTVGAGNYSHTFTNVPQAVGTGWYNVQVRDSAVPGTVYISGRRGIGLHIANYGQSQSTGQANTGDSTLTPTGMSRVHGNQLGSLVWEPLNSATMNGYIAADIMLNSLTGGKVPIAFLNIGYPGTGLVSGGPNGNWLPLTGPIYQYGKNMVAGLEGKVDAVVDIRGESDAAGSVTQANFYAGLGTLYSTTRTDFGNANLPIVQVILGNAGSYWNDAQGEVIKQAQVQRGADANMYRVECYDAPLSGDLLHRSATGYAIVGRRWALAVAKALGLAANYRSPRIATVSQVSSTVFDANLIYEVGSDFTPTSGITGLRVTDSVTSAVLTPTSVVRQSPTAIRITLGSAPANPIRVAAGYGATTTTNFASNGVLPLPLEYEAGITAIQVATNATITLQSQLGVLSANLTGLKWAFFDQSTPDLLAAPTSKGAVETTDASGVLVLNIAGTSLAPGAVGWLVVSDSDGTVGMTHKAFSGPVVVS